MGNKFDIECLIIIQERLDARGAEAKLEGKMEGKLLGEERVNTLILKLSALGRTDDIVKAAADQDYQKQLFEEFGL